ncbi:LamG-like jellyroll fold domain-containing protein [Botryobacter ruber]|uniref:LamG-like jellyroll fold domain-containing protein n=1 Tax=Botryobacter ruber TaxID=2171629 RepID=UPI0013E2EE79|nr:LamG-like jellyroll fold domain-containing protein [Botryobacter ruber]
MDTNNVNQLRRLCFISLFIIASLTSSSGFGLALFKPGKEFKDAPAAPPGTKPVAAPAFLATTPAPGSGKAAPAPEVKRLRKQLSTILVGHWKMDEGSGAVLADNSGNGNHATIQKTKDVTWVAGKDGLALNLPGTTDRFAVAPNQAVLNITDAITIAAWMRPLDVSTRTILSKSDPDGYELGINNDGKIEFRFNYDTNGNSYSLVSNATYTGNGSTWTHVAATFDGTTSRIYINGVEDAAVTYSSPVTINANTSALYIGSLDGSRRWKGGLDDLRLYHGALTSLQIYTLVQGEPSVPETPVLSSPANFAYGLPVSLNLNWEMTPGASSFMLQLAKNSDFASPVLDLADLQNSSVQTPDLDPDAQYFWRVKAKNQLGESAWSETWTFSTAPVSSGGPSGGSTGSILVGHWKMEEGRGEMLQDVSGYANNATIKKTRDVSWVAGVDGLSLYLPGTTDRFATVPNHASLNITDAITIAAWMRPLDVSTRTILSKSDPDGYELGINNDGKIEFRFNYDTNGNSYSLESNATYTGNGSTWTHVAATFDGTTSRIYINGVEDAAVTYSTPVTIRANTSALYIGSLDGSRRWKGGLDDLRLYNGALSAAEIDRVMRRAPEPPAPPLLASPENGAVDVAVNTVLSWNAAADAIGFSVQVSEFQDFSTTVFDQGSIATSSVEVTGLEAGKQYYWRVHASNDGGDSDWSEIWNFTTATPPPPPPVTAGTLFHYWNFNNSADLMAPTQTLTGGSLTAALTTASVIEAGTLNEFSGINARNGDLAETHLRLNTPIGSALTFHISTAGFEDIVFKYETRRSGSGAGLQKISYTLDGTTFVSLQDVTVVDGVPELVTLDFSAIAGANDNANFKVQVQFEQGAGGTAGNNRFDNVTVEGDALGAVNLPPVVSNAVGLQELVAGAAATEIDLSAVFSDPENDALTFTASSSNTAVATIAIAGNLLQITPLKAGDATVELKANDGNLDSAPATFRVLVYPAAQALSTGAFAFSSWDANEPEGSFPGNMLFLQSDVDDPGVEVPLLFSYAVPAADLVTADAGNVGFPYRNTSRTRINGLGDNGISFINTGRGRDLGAALVAVDTRNITDAKISFHAETLIPNFRVYNLAVFYRVGSSGAWSPVQTEAGASLVYESKELAENSLELLTGYLPAAAVGQEYVQVLFRYYFTGVQRVGGGARTQLRLDEINILEDAGTSTPVPAAPLLASPLNTAVDVACDPVLSWNAAAGATMYKVQVSENPDCSDAVVEKTNVLVNSVQVEGLQNSKQYYWRVLASNDGGDSEWSEIWSLTTTAAPATVATLFHYWNFNNTSDLLTPTQTLNSGSLTAALTTASAIEADDLQNFSGINARNGDLAETHLRLNTPIGSTLTFNVSTAGFEDIVFKYETRRSGSGAGLQKISYTLDGTTFVPLQDVTVVDGVPELVTLDFSAIAGANDNANFKVQVQFEQGAGGTAGNNRFDNVTVEGDALGAVNLPPVVSNAVGLQELVAGAAATEIDLSAVFSDPENDALTFTASSSNTAVATIAIAGNLLQITPLKAGDATIELKANDGNLDSAPATFRVLVYPAAQALSVGAFAFSSWDANEPEGSFPGNMLFLQSDVDDPGAEVPLLFPYAIPAADYNTVDLGNIGFPYRNTSRTRINGLGENGISFINTGRGRDLGAALVAVDTRDITDAKISFHAETLIPNYRVYNLAVFYRVGSSGAWSPVINEAETPLVYESKEIAENSLELLTGYLPAAAVGKEYVQVLFRYYFTGVQRVGGGARTQLRLDNIDILEDSRTTVLVPGQVVTLAPADNQQDVSLKPEFSWEATANASTYKVQVATDEQFTGLVVEEVVSGQTTYKPETALAVATDYFWRVMAVNSAGDGPWSAVKTFRTVLQATVYNLAINEVMSSNSNTIADEDGAFEDWIELVNYGTTPVNLEGFGLSDSYDNPFKWVFPAKTIAPGEFLLIWASSKNRVNPELPLHTSFAVSAQGEEVLLTSPDGALVDEMPPVAIASGLSRGRQPDGTGAYMFFDAPTPGATNQAGGYSELVAKAAFSVAPGIYPSAVSLAITHPDPAVTIRYTLDGSEPTAASPIYEQPLQIVDRSGEPNAHSMIPTNFIEGSSRSWNEPTGLVRKGTVVRAKAFKENTLNSAVTTGTYIILPGRQYTMPVVSVVTAFENLFGHETGIYVPGATYVSGDEETGNYNQLGDAWERPASIELFAPEVSFQENIGIRINGDFTRRFPQKSLRIVARGEYGNSYMNHPVFQNYPYSSFKRLVLRNAGNDWGTSMFKDAAAQYLVKHIMPTQNFRPSVVFINGEYWGIHNIRERADKHYLGRIYGVDPDNIDLLTYDYQINEGDNLHYLEMLDYIGKTDLSNDANFEGVKTRMDVDNFLDYFSAQIYNGNDDWPHSNIDFWRARVPYDPNAPAGQDGRWRWILYDADRAFGANSGGDASFNSVAWVISRVNGDINEEWPNFIMYHLLQNANFKNDLINRVADQLNTAFVTERVHHVVDSIRVIMEPEMEEHILRWGRPSSVSSWGKNVVDIKNFASVRPGYVRQHLREAFGLGAEIAVNLNVSDQSHGSIILNSLTINSKTVGANAQQPYPWQGTYFAGVPLQLKALAGEGYVFDYWLVDGQVYNQEALTLTPAANLSAVAFFVPTSGDKPILAAPVNAATDVAIAPTTVSWNSLPEATSYRLQVATVPDFATTVFDQSEIAATSAEVPDLVNNVLYYWRVMAVGNNGSSDWSATWSFRTESVLLPLPAVATLSAPANAATAVSLNPILTWNAAANATFYNVQVSTASDFTTLTVNQGNVAATSLKVTGLALNQEYFWRVQSGNGTGNANWSEAWSFTTLAEGSGSVLVGHWKMDEGSGETLLDNSGAGNHATLQKTKDVSWTAGVDGLALYLPGATDRFATVPSNATLNISDAITIAAWIRPVDVSTRTILSKTGADGYDFGVNNDGKLEFRINDDTSDGAYRIESGTSYPSNGSTWMHVAATFDGSTSKIYINGVEDATVTYAAPVSILGNTSPLYIGSQLTSRKWRGDLDDVRLYNGALNASEVMGLLKPVDNSFRLNPTSLSRDGQMEINVYPNPVTESVFLDFRNANTATVRIRITDVLGRKYLESDFALDGGKLEVNLSEAKMGAGVYFLTIQSKGYNNILKIIKK